MPRFTVMDAIDILLVAFGLYKLMTLIRGTRATAIIKGLAVLFVARALSTYFGLTTVGWLLERGTTGILLALPVVFYPELRRALEELGRGPLFGQWRTLQREDGARVLEEIARASAHLASTRTGALIVLERQTGLEEFIQTGTPVDALVTASLLENLFVPNTPLHDGAAIIRANRVVAAGAFLPLTENREIDPSLGSRHRAGLGISEQSDAAVVIVSEETGTISLAVKGRLVRHLDERGLLARLQGLDAAESKRFPFMLRR